MLQQLKVKNFALIRELNIQFDKKLNIITGETGAGKSILLGALGLILGERADVKSLMSDNEKCIIEGFFDVSDYGLQPFFAEHELDFDNTTIIRREINEAGKSRAFINDTPVQLNVLRELGDQLVSIHSQHETLSLNDRMFQLSVVDSFANHADELKQYAFLFTDYKKTEKQLKELRQEEATIKADLDYSTFLFNELKEARLEDEDEQEQLEKEQELLSNADEIRQSSMGAFHAISEGEPSVTDQLNQVRALLGNAAKTDERIAGLTARIDGTLIELKDIARELETIADTTHNDEERLQWLNSRLQLVYNLQKKHRTDNIKDLMTIQQQLDEKLGKASGLDDEINRLTGTLVKQKTELQEKADKISHSRKAQAAGIETRIAELLKQVGMPNASLKVEISTLEELNENGADAVNFLFSSNPGSSPQPLNKVASGGELSRLMLAIKSLVADNIQLPTLIFDEIDTGISGEVAAKTGRLMKTLADKHQVISVTHLPQIAGSGDSHYFVYKEVKNNSTETRLRKLTEQERVEEIAKMLSGDNPTESALANAKELLAAS